MKREGDWKEWKSEKAVLEVEQFDSFTWREYKGEWVEYREWNEKVNSALSAEVRSYRKF